MPLYLFLAGAGTGKSRNANEFHKSLAVCLPEEESELRSRIENAWVFHVSFENGTSYDPVEEKFAYRAIGTRMLLQLLPDKLLAEILTAYEAPAPEEVIRLVATHTRMNWRQVTVILAVDALHAIMSNYDEGLEEDSTFYRTMSKIADLGVNGMFAIPCCTATILGPINSFLRTSHRHRVYLPVATLTPPIIRQGDTIHQVFQMNDHIIKILVDDCGGHGRALEALECALEGVDISAINIDDLMYRVVNMIRNYYQEALQISVRNINAVVRAILTRHRLQADECVPGTNKLPEELAQPGLIRYEVEAGADDGYLTAPYIWIWVLARIKPSSADLVLRDWNFCTYGELRSRREPSCPPGAQFWQHFEHFIASFRSLKSRVFNEGQLVDFSKVHVGARINGDIQFVNHRLSLVRASGWENTSSANHPPGQWEVPCECSIKIDVRGCKHIILNGTSAPYGDSFLGLDTEAECQGLNEVHQYKRYNRATLRTTDYLSERAKAASERDFFLLYTTAQIEDLELPERSGIVDATNWLDYFGPFAGRAHYFAVVGPLDINTANHRDLLGIRGIGPAYAEQIISKRPFANIADAMERTKIPEKVLKKFKFTTLNTET
ncbi:uncharacterized protein VTP21DRAFT_9090 [Calcarisporiella thermophila]|uniref:uncharacterized protein n=1 Tax=Calcarisporiella thermophila TaxID=911321 RepID=UPI0037436E15